MLSQTRFDSIMTNQTGYAKKVYAAIPKVDAWSTSQVCAELSRLGHTINYRIIEGCLKTLVEAGVVVAISPDRYRAAAVRAKPTSVKSLKEVPEIMKQETVEAAPAPAPTPVVPTTSLQPPSVDRLIHLADALKTSGDMLVKMSEELTDIADSITRTIEADAANLQQLRQLQTLLRSIGMAGAN